MRWQPEEPDIRMVKLIMSMCTGVLMCNGSWPNATEILTVSLEKAARYEQEYEEECSRIPTPTEKELLSW